MGHIKVHSTVIVFLSQQCENLAILQLIIVKHIISGLFAKTKKLAGLHQFSLLLHRGVSFVFICNYGLRVLDVSRVEMHLRTSRRLGVG